MPQGKYLLRREQIYSSNTLMVLMLASAFVKYQPPIPVDVVESSLPYMIYLQRKRFVT